MPFDFDLAPLTPQHSMFVDQEGAALNPLVFFAIHLLLLNHIKQPAQAFIGVADQFEGEALLGLEVLVSTQAVFGYAQYQCMRGYEIGMQVTEVLAFGGAARGVVLGVEIDHQSWPGWR